MQVYSYSSLYLIFTTRTAFTAIVLIWLLCGVMLLSLVFFVHADEQAVSRNVRASLLLGSEKHRGLIIDPAPNESRGEGDGVERGG